MVDYSTKIEEIKKELQLTSNLRQIGNTTKKKYASYGLNQRAAASKYHPAKIVECRQNVVELRKLIHDWCQLEKTKKASLNQMNHDKWAFETEYGRIIWDVESEMQETFLSEPGFRFKANGDIKKSKKNHITNVAQCLKNWENVRINLNKETEAQNEKCATEKFSDISKIDPINQVANENLPGSCGSKSASKYELKREPKEERPAKETDTIIGTVNVTKEVEETEKALKEIYEDKEIKLLRAKSELPRKSSSSFLRALSRENQYSGGPDAIRRRCEMHRILSEKDAGDMVDIKEYFNSQTKFKSNCPACASKLRGHKDDYIDRKLKQLQRPLERWKTVSTNLSVDSLYQSSRPVKSQFSTVKMASAKAKTPSKERLPVAGGRLQPKSTSNILKTEGSNQRKEPVLHTKSTVDMERPKGGCSGVNLESDFNVGATRLTPRSRDRLTRIANNILQHAPVPKKGFYSRAIGDKAVSNTADALDHLYTEPLYHRMMERNCVSDKGSLDIFANGEHFDEYIEKHWDNVEMLARTVRLDESGDKHASGTKVPDFQDRKQLARTLRQRLRQIQSQDGKQKMRKCSNSTLELFKRASEMKKKASEGRINSFVQKLPPPTVSIERWRSHDGGNRSVFEVYAVNPECSRSGPGADQETDLDYEKDPYLINSELLIKELAECKLLTREEFT